MYHMETDDRIGANERHNVYTWGNLQMLPTCGSETSAHNSADNT
jgi:hypothetical protein